VSRNPQTPSRRPRKGSSISRLPRTLAACIAAVLLVAACGATAAAPSWTALPPTLAAASSPPSSLSPSAAATASPSPSPLASAAAVAFPLSVRDDDGTLLRLSSEPQRIVSLMPAITETLFALGEGSKVVGGTESDDFPAAAKAVPHVASYTGVQIEKVVALRPDLVVAGGDSGTQPADIARLRSLGLPVLVVYAGSVNAALADIRLLGTVSGTYPEAVAMTSAMRARIDAIAAAAAARPSHPRVFYELGDTPDLYGPSDDFFGVELIRLAGGIPITTGDPVSYTMPLERLVAADPEVIVLGDAAYGTTADAVAHRSGWEGMTAVRTGAIRPVDDTIVTRPGPRLADGLAALAQAIDPGLQLP